ncbi:MAG TPA: acyltransferase [Allosphingosinicella sp.]|jgi:peptidoglycan/LPS O-acetylase OafA/YrhL
MTAAAPDKGGEILALTALRGIAAWWVVLFHLRLMLVPYLPPAAIRFLAHGNLAVDFFFLLSGFVMYLNYAGRIRGWPSVGDFLFSRFARVYPLHLLMLLGFLGYFGAAALFGRGGFEESPGYFAASLLLVQNWGFLGRLGWNVPAWSISAEAFAYLLFPALLLGLAPAKRPAWFLVAAAAVLGVSVHLYFAAFGFDFPNEVPRTGLFRCVVQFTMGMMLCELYRRLAGRPELKRTLILAAAVLAAAYVSFGAPVLPLAWAALILAYALGRGGLFEAPPLVWLGRVSYATYLCHYLALTLFRYAFVEEGKPVAPALLGLYLLGVLAASAGLYHGFERPAQRRLLAWRRARRARLEPRPA